MQALTLGDYEKVVNFMDEMANPIKDFYFRTHVLNTFEKLFGFHQSNFWLVDDHTNFINPVKLNVEQHAMNDYLSGCFQWDYHTPQNMIQKLAKKRVWRIEDIVPIEQYEGEAYYNEFMYRHGFYHQMVTYLIHRGKLLGGVAFMRPKTDSAFTVNDVTCTEIITRYLSECMVNFAKKKEPQEAENSQITSLSLKEREVFDLVQKGFSNKEISQKLYVSINTVKKHLQNIYKKYDVTNRTSLCYKLNKNNNLLT